MDNHNQEKDSVIKQLILIIGLAIAILVVVLFASGLFFNGAVVTSMDGAVKESHQKSQAYSGEDWGLSHKKNRS